uniref:Uncharacterized protein n=1 Tax=Triticum urartu TaxID=4572 RepID=A0A8R7P4N6_TRIUA
ADWTQQSSLRAAEEPHRHLSSPCPWGGGGNTCSVVTRLCERRRRERAAEGVESGSCLRLGASVVAARLEAAHEAVMLEHYAAHELMNKGEDTCGWQGRRKHWRVRRELQPRR